MRKEKILPLSLLLALLLPFPALSQESKSGCALDAKVGTLGIGADLSCSLVPRILNFRAGASFFSYSTDFDEKGINYRGKLRLGAVPIALDIFPFKNWFRLGGGLIINLNEVSGTAVSNQGSVTIGDHRYNLQDFGQLSGKAKFNRAAPYFGIGFNNPVKRKGHWGFFADLGVMYHGRPSIALTAAHVTPQLQVDLNKEIQQVNDDVKKFTIFPVVQLGVSYRF
jgi:hypothetical protein